MKKKPEDRAPESQRGGKFECVSVRHAQETGLFQDHFEVTTLICKKLKNNVSHSELWQI